ncbi:MAG: hypothetical protein Aseana_13460 [Candidatus Pelagadaptatus aseana]
MAVFLLLLGAVQLYFHTAIFDDIELTSAENQLNKIANQFKQNPVEVNGPVMDLNRQTKVYVGSDNLPESLKGAQRLEYYQAEEFNAPDVYGNPIYLMKIPMQFMLENNQSQMIDGYIQLFDSFFEGIEDDLEKAYDRQMYLTIGLLILALVLLLKISRWLTQPLSNLSRKLATCDLNSIEPLPENDRFMPYELGALQDSIRKYQQYIIDLLTRERAFNQYASHELRTPLMVIQGATNLLAEASREEFTDRQCARISRACNEMRDFVETLLALTREDTVETDRRFLVTSVFINEIMDGYHFLLADKKVISQVVIESEPELSAIESSVKILLGNLIKNAFSYTQSGEVVVRLKYSSICVEDTGIGLKQVQQRVEGYGLGLLIANDICRKHGWHLQLQGRDGGGCIARVDF